MIGEKKWCFCTLALGESYRRLAEQLADDLAIHAPGISLVLLTDKVRDFDGVANVQAFRHRQRSVQGFNDKLCVMKRALDRFETAVFIDADARILAPVVPVPEMFRPGLKTWLIRKWGWMYENYDQSASGPPWQKEDLRILGLLSDKYGLKEGRNETPYVVEFLFSVTRDEVRRTERFLQKWNELAEFCERSRFFRHEGYALGLAAKLTGFPVEQFEFQGIKFFEPQLRKFIGKAAGAMTQEEYDALNATVARFKNSEQARRGWVPREWQRKARYWRVKLFGLDLLAS